jgi:hypothetical protein
MTIYKVFVDDNFHYQDESERYEYGQFQELGEAIATCRRLVDADLVHMASNARDASDLYGLWVMFGTDPFILLEPPAPGAVPFAANRYARSRCRAITAAGPPPDDR